MISSEFPNKILLSQEILLKSPLFSGILQILDNNDGTLNVQLSSRHDGFKLNIAISESYLIARGFRDFQTFNESEKKNVCCSIVRDLKVEETEAGELELVLQPGQTDRPSISPFPSRFKCRNKRIQGKKRVCLCTKGFRFHDIGLKTIVNFWEDCDVEGVVLEVFAPEKNLTCFLNISSEKLLNFGIDDWDSINGQQKQRRYSLMLQQVVLCQDKNGYLRASLKDFNTKSTRGNFREVKHKTTVQKQFIYQAAVDFSEGVIQKSLQHLVLSNRRERVTSARSWIKTVVGTWVEAGMLLLSERRECAQTLTTMVDFISIVHSPFGLAPCFEIHQKHSLSERQLRTLKEANYHHEKALQQQKEMLKQVEERANINDMKFQSILHQLNSTEKAFHHLKTELQSIFEEKEALQNAIHEEKDINNLLKRDNKMLKSDNLRLSKVLEQCEGELLASKEEATLSHNALVESEQKRESLCQDVQALNEQHMSLLEKCKELLQQTNAFQTALSDESKKYRNMEIQRNELSMEKTELVDKIETLESICEEQKEKLEFKDQEIFTLQKQRKRLNAEKLKLEELLKQALAQAEQITSVKMREIETTKEVTQLQQENQLLSKQLGNALARELQIRSHIFRGEDHSNHVINDSSKKVLKQVVKVEDKKKRKPHRTKIGMLPAII